MKNQIEGIPSRTTTPESEDSLGIMMAEYKRLAAEIDSTYSKMNQVLAVATSVLGVMIGLITNRTITTPAVIWAAPAVILVIYGFAITLSARWSSHVFQIRLVCDRLVELTGESPILFYDHQESMVSRFNSLKSGNSKYRLTVFAIFLVIAIFLIYLLVHSFLIIYSNNHLWGVIFVASYALLLAIYAGGFLSVLRDLPGLFYEIRRVLATQPSAALSTRSLVKSEVSFIHFLLPRPLDFVTKTWLFFLGVTITSLENGLFFNQRIWDLFVSQSARVKPPFWTIIAFALCWYVIQEGMIQQAKYLWNDVRDRETDKHIEGKSSRVVARGIMHIEGVIFHLTIRWTLGLLFSALLDYRLLLLAVAISIVHILYELWAKPNSSSRPLIAMALVAIGSPLRVLGGILAAGEQLTTRGVLFLAGFFFFGIGYIANFWRIEAEYVEEKEDLSISPRPLSDYFRKNGTSWQHFGLTGFFVSALILLIDASLCASSGVCIDNLGLLLAPRGSFLRILVLSLMFACITLILSPLAWSSRKVIANAVLSVLKKPFIVIFLGVSAISGALLLDFGIEFLVAAAILGFSSLAFEVYKDMDYEQYMLIHMRKNIGLIGQLWFAYLFNANSGLSFSKLIAITGLILQNDVERLNKERFFDT